MIKRNGSKVLNFIIVEKDEDERRRLEEMLLRVSVLPEVTSVSSISEAIHELKRTKFDGMFLDTGFPEARELDFHKRYRALFPPAVFTASDGALAVWSFDIGAVDYVCKPADEGRIELAVSRICLAQKVRCLVGKNKDVFGSDGRMLIPHEDGLWIVQPRDILYLEAVGNYSRVAFGQRKVLVRRTLKHMEHALRSYGFFRSSRDRIINLECVTRYSLTPRGTIHVAFTDGQECEMSRRRAREFKQSHKI